MVMNVILRWGNDGRGMSESGGTYRQIQDPRAWVEVLEKRYPKGGERDGVEEGGPSGG